MLQNEEYQIKNKGCSKQHLVDLQCSTFIITCQKLTSNSLIFSSAILCFSKSWLWITPLDWRINLQVKNKRQTTVGYVLHLLYTELHTKLNYSDLCKAFVLNPHVLARSRRNCYDGSHKPPRWPQGLPHWPHPWRGRKKMDAHRSPSIIQCPWMIWKQFLHTASKESLSSHSFKGI